MFLSLDFCDPESSQFHLRLFFSKRIWLATYLVGSIFGFWVENPPPTRYAPTSYKWKLIISLCNGVNLGFFFTFHPSRSSYPTLLIPNFPAVSPNRKALSAAAFAAGAAASAAAGGSAAEPTALVAGEAAMKAWKRNRNVFLFGGSSHLVSGQLGYNSFMRFMTRVLL